MIGVSEILSFASLLRDSSYDAVFAFGDTSLQFGAELIHGPQNTRYGQYAYRQIERQQKPLQAKAPQKPRKQAKATQKSIREKPLKFEEKRSFAEMMRREPGESIIEHWKRQKSLLAFPEKQQLVRDYVALKSRIETEQLAKKTIQTEMRSISSQYQKKQAPKRAPQKARTQRR